MTDVSLTSAPQPNLSPVKTDREACASCGAAMAGDQRYCLECGQRRGEPRLPFMNAVVLMEAVKAARQPPAPPKPPKRKRSAISPNAALITGIGTLLLALGIGVLIGHSGTHEVAQTAAAPQVITVGSTGGEATTGGSHPKGATTGGGNASKAKSKKQKQAALKESEAHPAAEEVLKPAGNVDLPPSTVKPGDKCQSGEAGCEDGEFTGNFFE